MILDTISPSSTTAFIITASTPTSTSLTFERHERPSHQPEQVRRLPEGVIPDSEVPGGVVGQFATLEQVSVTQQSREEHFTALHAHLVPRKDVRSTKNYNQQFSHSVIQSSVTQRKVNQALEGRQDDRSDRLEASFIDLSVFLFSS